MRFGRSSPAYLLALLWLPAAHAGALSRLPLYFEPNAGQAAQEVEFIVRGGSGAIVLAAGEIVIPAGRIPVRLHLRNALPPTAVEGLEPFPGVTNYLRGNNREQWRTGVPHYGKVRYHEVYPGIDLVFYGSQRELEYDFDVAPGADPGRIEFEWDGVNRVRLDRSGGLVLQSGRGEVRLHRPRVYQETGGRRRPVAARFQLRGDRRAGFSLGRYNRRAKLVIDPVLSYSGYMGSTGFDSATAVAVDAAGNLYVCGGTAGAGLTPVNPAQAAYGGGFSDAFVAKINAAGTALAYLTFLGGNDMDRASSIAVDADGNVYVGGYTQSPNFPVAPAPGAFQPALKGDSDAFAAKLSPGGNSVVYSTYLGGAKNEQVGAVAVDAQGALYLAGATDSTDFPATSGAFRTAKPGTVDNDVWVAKLNPAGTGLVYATYLGGTDFETSAGLAVDGAGNAYVTGSTYSRDYPVTPGAFVTANPGVQKGYVTKINPAGSGLVYSTYFCGASDSFASIAVDESGHAYITGWTPGGDIPITPGAYRTTGIDAEAFLAKLNSTGTSLLFSTYLGGSDADFGGGVKVNQAGNAYVIGNTTSSNFPTAGGPYQASRSSTQFGFDGTLTVFNPMGTGIVYSTYFGGPGEDVINALAIDAEGSAYLGGYTDSATFPLAPAANFGSSLKGGSDAFAAKLGGFNLPACQAPLSASSASYPAGGGTGTVTVQASAGCNWHGLASTEFVTIAGGTSGGIAGSGAGAVAYAVAPNTGTTPRTASIGAAGGIVQIIQSGTGTAAPFTDVPASHPYFNHLWLMKSNGVTSGCTATEYCPDATTTRSQMGVFIIRSLLGGDNFPYSQTPYFADVPAAHPHFKWVQKMRELVITSGCSATAYCPDEPVTRGQMAVFIVRALLGNTFTFSATPYFSDAAADHPYFRFIQKMREWGITSGCTASAYCPDAPATRGQMGVFLIRGFFTPR